ncbi:hypothetical protein N657DRAFT_657283 [Parathielavia appendiculata]|uniref:Uncharacterized protein n=1 Tax=Parathielavia appendiculata TaxID=2587402 RepID=A0AAN6TYG4_9PEZI|nr:hypothetical protein N657DRAFT_657283 [Parathielavia appendiculata]
MGSLAVILATALLFAGLTTASPSFALLINAQVPPVARIGQLFSFWLSIESDSWRLFGTPGPDDVPSGELAGVPVSLVATDDTGSTTHTATFVVSRAPSAILSAPGKAFSFRLDLNTFSIPPGIPSDTMPPWLTTRRSRPRYPSTPPGSLSPARLHPRNLSFSLHSAFLSESLPATWPASREQLWACGADETVIVLNATPDPGTVSIASTANMLPWLSANKHTWHMTGVPPENTESPNFTLNGGTSGLFTGSLPGFAIIPGKPFSFDRRPYLLNPQDTEISVETSSPYSWIQFGASTVALFGEAPGSLKDGLDSKKSAALSFNIVVHSSGSHRPLTGDGSGNGQFNPVLLVVLLPLLLLLALAVCALFGYLRRRRTARDLRSARGTYQFLCEYLSSSTPSTEPGDTSSETGGTFAVVSKGLVTLRPGARGKISSSLSFIIEPSIGELVDSQDIDSAGHDSRQSLLDKIEINVLRLQNPKRAFTASPSPTDATSTPRPVSPRTAPENVSLRAESRFSYYPPASSVRKLSWRWLEAVKGRRQGSKLLSVLMVDTQDSKKTEQPPPTPQFPGRALFSRPSTRGSGPATSTKLEHPSREQARSSDIAASAAIPASSSPVIQEKSTPVAGIVGLNPFHPSKTWSRVPTMNEWVDETVSSLALSRTASQHQQNWTVLQEPPVNHNKYSGEADPEGKKR